jgi:hypothetical protein
MIREMLLKNRKLWLAFVALVAMSTVAVAQSRWQTLAAEEDKLGIEKGFIETETAGFTVKFVKESQTLAALQPKGAGGFDFTPSDRLVSRKGNRLYHLGDLNLRVRPVESNEWKKYSSAAERVPVKAIPTTGMANVLAAADMGSTFAEDMPLKVERFWQTENGDLVLRFKITNKTAEPLELGSVGIPMIFNNILDGKNLDAAHAECSFYDPYIGQDAGYLQVSRLTGTGQVLLVVPYGKTPFEAYNPLLDDRTPRGITFEGFYEWMALSRAYSEDEWKSADPWNLPRSKRLNPGQSVEYGVKFILAESLRDIEPTLIGHNRPVAMGIPGYVVPMDINAKLFLNYNSPVRSLDVHPGGALTIVKGESTPNGWKSYSVSGKEWGRARLTVTYEDGLKQTIHYNVIKAEEQVVADLGKFLTNEQWYENPDDLFNRHLSVISYDYGKMQQVTEDSRSWVAGLSDEGGAGSWLAAMMKQLVLPDAEELKKMQLFVHETIWGGIQYSEGPKKYGVRKSMFYYDPENMPEGTYSKNINYSGWSAWKKSEAESTGRSYNYPHVAAAYWVMYQLARNHEGLVTTGKWDWYLEQAYHTAIAMVEQAPHYAQFGQMEGTVFFLILLDLKIEGMDEMAKLLEEKMRKRADLWKSLKYPFGSEMPWDSTGQEEVYMWSRYFGYSEKADVTLNAILAYMPTVPHWGYNGSARRYWDFQYAGKLQRVERQLHHYGSGLNAIPVLTEFRDNPDDFYLLRVGHAGLMGSISNITKEGFGPSGFHAYPATLRIDHLTGDYGPNFFGYAVNTGTYLTKHSEFGWLGFSGNVEESGKLVTIRPTSAARSNVFIAPLGLWLTLDAGRFESVTLDTKTGIVTVRLEKATTYTSKARLSIEQSAKPAGAATYAIPPVYPLERGAYVVTLKNEPTEIIVRPAKK